MKKQIEQRITLFGQEMSWANLVERMRRCNVAQKFTPLWKTLDSSKVKELEKLVKVKK